jgi:CheY-like chemotaxis protein
VPTAREQLVNSLDAFPQAVVLFDKDDRLVFENAAYRKEFTKQFDRDPHGLSFEEVLRVTIYSEPDVGTTVKLYLPRSIEASEEQKEEPSTLPPPAREETVLVVEDDADVRALTVTLVGSLGYEVLETANGPAALELLEQQPTVDILLTDVVLPHGLSGPEIAQRARKIVPGLKVLFMSGYAESAITHRGELEEGLVFLQKPFGLDDLANKLRTVLDGES